MPRIILQIRFR